VAGKSDGGRSSSGGELDDRPVKRRLVVEQDEFFATVPDPEMTKDTMSFTQPGVERRLSDLRPVLQLRDLSPIVSSAARSPSLRTS
jgi:hypothetical protein